MAEDDANISAEGQQLMQGFNALSEECKELGDDGAITANAVAVAQSELQLMEEISSYLTVANTEIERLRAELEESQRDRTSLEQQLEKTQEELTSAKGDLEALQDANEELSFQVGALSKDLDLARKFDRELMSDSAPSETDTVSINQQMEGETLEVCFRSSTFGMVVIMRRLLNPNADVLCDLMRFAMTGAWCC
eukprot:m.93462 g.93462  ORF g.93462 m.93462 type:complete len:194 (-) comp14985_c0_seq16:1453-2034(-)